MTNATNAMPVKTLLAAMLALSCLAGCSGVREAIGLDRRSPDEFSVVTRAPLEMPPEGYSLAPPTPGAQRPQEAAVSTKAQEVLFGRAPVVVEGVSGAEAALLDRAGADAADPAIRQTLTTEKSNEVAEDQPVFDRLLGRITSPDEAPARVIDPVAETERLKKNKEAGLPVNDGDVPSKVK